MSHGLQSAAEYALIAFDRDCCKPTCAWTGKGVDKPVQVCDKSDKPLTGGDSAPSGCNGGTAYMCSSQSPWKVSDDLAYGFASVTAANPNCCECYQLTFTSGPISGKKMVVQATNTGTDVGSTQFDIAVSEPFEKHRAFLIKPRSLVVALDFSMVVRLNGVLPLMSGERNMVAKQPRTHAPNFLPL